MFMRIHFYHVFLFHYFIVAIMGKYLGERAALGSTFVFKKFDISINIGKFVKNVCIIMPLCFCYSFS